MANKFIYKLPSKRLKDAGWNLELPLSCAMKNQNDLVALSDSQLLRWICELNHSEHLDQEVSRVKKEIGRIRKMPPQQTGPGETFRPVRNTVFPLSLIHI